MRKFFRKGDDTWDAYARWIELPKLAEVRSVDSKLNDDVGDRVVIYPPYDDVLAEILTLPRVIPTKHYQLLAVNLTEETAPLVPEGALLLGYDLSDDTLTSSILSCGPWRGRLALLAERLNQYGLLSLKDAESAQELLPQEWGDEEPHACVDIWALYDVTSLRSGSAET